MRVVFIENQETFNKLHTLSRKRLAFGAREAVEKFLRKEFNDAGTDPTASSVIDVAREFGMHDLADELTSDFYVETGKEVRHAV